MNSLKNIFVLSLFVALFSCQKEASLQLEELPIEEPIVILPENKLPQVYIQTNGAEIVDEPKVDAQMIISVNDVVDYDGAIGIEIRGSSSQGFPKKQFGFETRDAANEDLNVSLLGFPEEEDWILYLLHGFCRFLNLVHLKY